MKNIKTFLAVVAMLVAAMGSAAAQTWTSGGCTVTLNDGTLTVSKTEGGNGVMANYVENGEYENIVDTPWDDFWYQITSIVINEGVKEIGVGAFAFLYEVSSVTLPASVISIGRWAFYAVGYGVDSRVVNYNGTLTKWCNIYFTDWQSNPAYKTIWTDGSVSPAADLVIQGHAIRNLVIPNDVTSVGFAAFIGCNLQTVVIPSGVTSIGHYSFQGCSSPIYFISSTVTNIASEAFYYAEPSDIYLAADPAGLTWDDGDYNDECFLPDRGTKVHVPQQYLAAYQAGWPDKNVTFVGDLYTLKDIPEGWTVTVDGAQLEVNANHEAMVGEGSAVVLTPTDRDKPRVKSVSIVPAD